MDPLDTSELSKQDDSEDFDADDLFDLEDSQENSCSSSCSSYSSEDSVGGKACSCSEQSCSCSCSSSSGDLDTSRSQQNAQKKVTLPVDLEVSSLGKLISLQKQEKFEEAWTQSEICYREAYNTKDKMGLSHVINSQCTIARELDERGVKEPLEKCLVSLENIFESFKNDEFGYKAFIDSRIDTLDEMSQYLTSNDKLHVALNFFNKLINKLEIDFGKTHAITCIAKVCKSKCYLASEEHDKMWDILKTLVSYVKNENDHKTALLMCTTAIHTKNVFRAAKSCYTLLRKLTFEYPYEDGKMFIKCVNVLTPVMHDHLKDEELIELYQKIDITSPSRPLADYYITVCQCNSKSIETALESYQKLCTVYFYPKSEKSPQDNNDLLVLLREFYVHNELSKLEYED